MASYRIIYADCIIRVLRGEDLMISDRTSSDPFVVITCGKQKAKTAIVRSSLDPLWDEVHHIHWRPEDPLVLQVWDFDLISSNDFMGEVIIPFDKAREDCDTMLGYDLQPREGKKDKGIQGQIFIQLSFPGIAVEEAPPLPPDVRIHACLIQVERANNLPRLGKLRPSDPYVVVRCHNNQFKTAVQDNTLDPVWDASFLLDEWREDLPLSFCVLDFNLLVDAFVGRVLVTYEAAVKAGGAEMTLPLLPRDKHDKNVQGTLTVRLQLEGMAGYGSPAKASAVTGVFGRTLRSLREESGSPIPMLVQDAAASLDVSQCGIFRLCGNAAEVKELKLKYKTGQVSLADDLKQGPWSMNTIASLLKRFFFDLPEPIVPYEDYDALVLLFKAYEGGGDKVVLVKEATEIVGKLPEENGLTLAFLLRFLLTVIAQSDINQMTMQNVAICFGPSLMRAKVTNQDTLFSQYDSKLVSLFLEHLKQIFAVWMRML